MQRLLLLLPPPQTAPPQQEAQGFDGGVVEHRRLDSPLSLVDSRPVESPGADTHPNRPVASEADVNVVSSTRSVVGDRNRSGIIVLAPFLVVLSIIVDGVIVVADVRRKCQLLAAVVILLLTAAAADDWETIRRRSVAESFIVCDRKRQNESHRYADALMRLMH
jgi:hypothetical protein